MPFSDLAPRLASALTARGYTELTPVQTAVTQPDAKGRDLLVSAKTGSGKTVAYGLAMSDELFAGKDQLGQAGEPLALVIAPTRELAQQVQRELEWLYAAAGAKVVACVGGMDPRKEGRALAQGAHIVVGTPGRLRDHIERNQLVLTDLRVAVLDEADEMLDLGFKEELEAILDASPDARRTLLFSATLPKPIVALARQYQRDAFRITVAGAKEAHGDIDYRAIRIAPSDTEHAVVNLLRYFDPGAALVFCSTREAVRRLHANLVERGFAAVALSGELSQNERTHALQALRDRRTRVCVATDVAARGIDIPNLELVIHAELPHDAQSMQHRSGRTGRAGKKGVCAILVPHPRSRRAEAMLATANIQAAWTPAPTAEDIRLKDQERLVEQLRPTEEASEDDLTVARFLLAEADAEQVVAALVRGRRAALPAAEDLVDNEPVYSAPRESTGPRPGFEDTAWFSINLGRNKNAEARWILPLICRKGHLTKQDIGAIRIFDRETRFEIVRAALDRFQAAIAKGEEDGITIEPAEPDLPAARDRKPMHKKPYPPKAASGGGGGYGDRDARPPRPRDNAASPPKPYKAKSYEGAKPYAPALDTPPTSKKPFDKPRAGKPYKGKPKREG